MLKNKKILFPRKGCEELLTQLTSFGYEKHDDLADAACFGWPPYAMLEPNY
jgi:phage terminase large subunit-like protein